MSSARPSKGSDALVVGIGSRPAPRGRTDPGEVVGDLLARKNVCERELALPSGPPRCDAQGFDEPDAKSIAQTTLRADHRGIWHAKRSGMMLVRNAMVHEVVALDRETSLRAAARLFAVHGISGAPVIEDDGKAIGVVTQRDLIDAEKRRSRRAGRGVYYRVLDGTIHATGLVLADGVGTDGVAEDVMSAPIVTIEYDDPLALASRRMLKQRVHRLFVLDRGRVIGIVTSLDCLRAFVGEED